jgi:hypothetical protein
MEVVNDSAKLVAQAIQELKCYLRMLEEHETWEDEPVETSITLLESALEKLTSK